MLTFKWENVVGFYQMWSTVPPQVRPPQLAQILLPTRFFQLNRIKQRSDKDKGNNKSKPTRFWWIKTIIKKQWQMSVMFLITFEFKHCWLRWKTPWVKGSNIGDFWTFQIYAPNFAQYWLGEFSLLLQQYTNEIQQKLNCNNIQTLQHTKWFT